MANPSVLSLGRTITADPKAYRSCSISETKKIIIYNSSNNKYARVLDWSSGTLSYGTELNLGAQVDYYRSVGIEYIGNNEAIISYMTYENYLIKFVTRKLTVSGTSLTAGTEGSYYFGGTDYWSPTSYAYIDPYVATASATKYGTSEIYSFQAMIFQGYYKAASNRNRLSIGYSTSSAVAMPNQTTITTYDSTYQQNSCPIRNPRLICLDTAQATETRFLCTYYDSYLSNNYAVVITFTWSSNTFSVKTPIALGNYSHVIPSRLNENKVLIAYQSGNSTIRSRILTISTYTISAQTEYTSSRSVFNELNVRSESETEGKIFYSNNTSAYKLYSIPFTVSTNEITYSDPIEIQTLVGTTFPDITQDHLYYHNSASGTDSMSNFQDLPTAFEYSTSGSMSLDSDSEYYKEISVYDYDTTATLELDSSQVSTMDFETAQATFAVNTYTFTGIASTTTPIYWGYQSGTLGSVSILRGDLDTVIAQKIRTAIGTSVSGWVVSGTGSTVTLTSTVEGAVDPLILTNIEWANYTTTVYFAGTLDGAQPASAYGLTNTTYKISVNTENLQPQDDINVPLDGSYGFDSSSSLSTIFGFFNTYDPTAYWNIRAGNLVISPKSATRMWAFEPYNNPKFFESFSTFAGYINELIYTNTFVQGGSGTISSSLELDSTHVFTIDQEIITSGSIELDSSVENSLDPSEFDTSTSGSLELSASTLSTIDQKFASEGSLELDSITSYDKQEIAFNFDTSGSLELDSTSESDSTIEVVSDSSLSLDSTALSTIDQVKISDSSLELSSDSFFDQDRSYASDSNLELSSSQVSTIDQIKVSDSSFELSSDSSYDQDRSIISSCSLELDSTSSFDQGRDINSIGSITLDTTSLSTIDQVKISDSSLELSSDRELDWTSDWSIESSGELVLTSESTVVEEENRITSGSLSLDSIIDIDWVSDWTTSSDSSFELSSDSISTIDQVKISDSSLELDSISLSDSGQVFTTSGSLELDSSSYSDIDQEIITSGSIELSSESIIKIDYEFISSGSIELSSESVYDRYSIPDFVSSGSIDLSSESVSTYDIDYIQYLAQINAGSTYSKIVSYSTINAFLADGIHDIGYTNYRVITRDGNTLSSTTSKTLYYGGRALEILDCISFESNKVVTVSRETWNYKTVLSCLTFSGTTLTNQYNVELPIYDMSYCKLVHLNNNYFIVSYYDPNVFLTKFRVFYISGNNLVDTTHVNGWRFQSIHSLTNLDSTHFLITYYSSGQQTGIIQVIATYTGSGITFTSAGLGDTAQYGNYTISKYDTNKIIIQRRISDYEFGVRIATIDGNRITYSNESTYTNSSLIGSSIISSINNLKGEKWILNCQKWSQVFEINNDLISFHEPYVYENSSYARSSTKIGDDYLLSYYNGTTGRVALGRYIGDPQVIFYDTSGSIELSSISINKLNHEKNSNATLEIDSTSIISSDTSYESEGSFELSTAISKNWISDWNYIEDSSLSLDSSSLIQESEQWISSGSMSLSSESIKDWTSVWSKISTGNIEVDSSSVSDWKANWNLVSDSSFELSSSSLFNFLKSWSYNSNGELNLDSISQNSYQDYSNWSYNSLGALELASEVVYDFARNFIYDTRADISLDSFAESLWTAIFNKTTSGSISLSSTSEYYKREIRPFWEYTSTGALIVSSVSRHSEGSTNVQLVYFKTPITTERNLFTSVTNEFEVETKITNAIEINIRMLDEIYEGNRID